MAKKRKSIRRPNRLIEEEEELVQDAVEAQEDEPDADIVDLTEGQEDTDEERENFAMRVDGELPNVDAMEGSEDGEEQTEDQAELEARKKAQEEWDTFREEYHEVVEQLPLSLYRHSTLMHELDTKVQDHLSEMLPLIRSYISLRQSLAPKPTQEPPANVPLIHVEESSTPPPLSAEGSKENADAPVPETRRSSTVPELAPSDIPLPVSTAPSENPGTPFLNRMQADTPMASPGLFSTAPPTPTSSHSRLSGPNGLGFTRSHSAFLLKAALKAKGKDPQTTREILVRLNWLTCQMMRASEEKFGLASATYDSVDRHVRALDASIKEYETSLVLGLRPGTRPLQSVLTTGDAAILAAGDEADGQLTLGLGIAGSAGAQARPKKRKRDRERERKREKERERRAEKRRAAEEAKIAQEMAERGEVPPDSGDEDEEEDTAIEGKQDPLLPVHPNEPRYCYCNQVSFGAMIGCDNPDCEREWFHYSCVGVKEAPKPDRKWYCKDCTVLYGKSKKKKKSS